MIRKRFYRNSYTYGSAVLNLTVTPVLTHGEVRVKHSPLQI